MATTSNLTLTLVDTAQAQKEVTVNTALSRIDAILNTGAKDKDLNTPPGSPAAGDVYIVSTAPTGTWAGYAKNIAYFDQIWRFIAPNEGMTLWVSDEDKVYSYNGSSWVISAALGGRQMLYLPAVKMRPSASGGCAALAAAATSANRPDVVSLDFDAATEEYAQISFRMPKAWNEGTVTAVFEWSHASTATNFGVVWGIQGVSVSDGDLVDAAYGTAQEVTDTGGTANTLYKSPETAALTLAGSPQENDTVFLRVYRKAASASDTLAVDARLHGVALFYTTNAMTDD